MGARVRKTPDEMGYTQEQNTIIHHTDGHAMVSAVPGSGKTTTMVGFVIECLRRGVKPQNILVLMFNKAAAENFSAKMQKTTPVARKVNVRTFHSLGYRLCATMVKKGMLPDWSLESKDWVVESIARSVLQQVAPAARAKASEWLDDFISFIDLVKSDVLSPREKFDELGLDKNKSCFLDAFELFESERRDRKLRFYNDLLYDPVCFLIREPDAARGWLSNALDHIVIDEYQDTNPICDYLVKYIAGTRAQLVVVGDPDQSIYRFRGARPELFSSGILGAYSGVTRYALSTTFRYGPVLSTLANTLIRHSPGRDLRDCISADNTPCTTVDILNEGTSGRLYSSMVRDWLQTDPAHTNSDVAVLLRLFSMSATVQLDFLKHDVPFTLEGHEPVFETRLIKSMLGYLYLAAGLLSDHREKISIIEAMMSSPSLMMKRDDLKQLIRHVSKNPSMAGALIHASGTQCPKPYLAQKLYDRSRTWTLFAKGHNGAKAGSLLRQLVDSMDLYTEIDAQSTKPEQAFEQINLCHSFIAFAERQNLGLEDFLVLVEQLKASARASQKDSNAVLITSIHRAKGLEYPFVIVPSLKEGLFPYCEDSDPPSVVEDERRLFFVAMTRAIKKLVVTHPVDKHLEHWKKKPNSQTRGQEASRFIYDLYTEDA